MQDWKNSPFKDEVVWSDYAKSGQTSCVWMVQSLEFNVIALQINKELQQVQGVCCTCCNGLW